jgi:uncharacterized protein with PIN domain
MNKKRTHEEFIELIESIVGDEYFVLGTYEGAKKKVLMQHNKCNGTFLVQPLHFLGNAKTKGTRCPHCFRNFKKTTEQFIDEVYNLVMDEYKVLGEYTGADKKIEMKHSECGYVYKVAPKHFLYSESRCPLCNGGIKGKDTEFIKKEIFGLVGDEYLLLDEYVNANTKFLLKHNIVECGFSWKVTPGSFLNQGARCPKCSGRYKTTEVFKDEVYKLVEDDYIVLGEYTRNDNNIKMKHTFCGEEFETSPRSFLLGKRCPPCTKLKTSESISKANAKTHEQFIAEVKQLTGNEYLVLEKYNGCHTKISFKHNSEDCGYDFKMIPSSFVGGHRCPNCRISKGETKIKKFLEIHNIDFLQQYMTENCRNVYPLRFDFAIYENEKLYCIIEYDGEFHYKKVSQFGGKEKLRKQKHNDQIKNQYCQQNNIPLIRIPYWDFFNVEKILECELHDLIQKKNNIAYLKEADESASFIVS